MRSHKCFARRSLFGLRLSENLTARRKYLEDFTGEHMCIASAEVLSLCQNRRRGPILLFENLGRQISEKNDERRLITIQSTSRKLAAVFMFISLALGSQTVAVGRQERASGRQIA